MQLKSKYGWKTSIRYILTVYGWFLPCVSMCDDLFAFMHHPFERHDSLKSVGDTLRLPGTTRFWQFGAGSCGPGRMGETSWDLPPGKLQMQRRHEISCLSLIWWKKYEEMALISSPYMTETFPMNKNRNGFAILYFLLGCNCVFNCGNWKSIGE